MKRWKNLCKKLVLAISVAMMMFGTCTTALAFENEAKDGTAFTDQGTAKTQDDIVDDGSTKEFLTIRTKNNQTFYVVIDRSGASENVYLLSEVDEDDLAKFLSEEQKTTVKDNPAAVILENKVDTTEQETPEKETTVKTEQKETKTKEGSNLWGYLTVVVLACGVGVAAYYFFIFRRRQEEDDENQGMEQGVEELDTIDEDEENDEN